METEYSTFISSAIDSVSSNTAKSILNEISKENNFGISSLGLIFDSINNDVLLTKLIKILLFSLVLFIVLNLICNLFSEKNTYLVIKYCGSVAISLTITVPIYELIEHTTQYISDISLFLGVLSPTVGALTAIGGNVASAKTQGAFFSILLSAVQFLLSKILPYVVTFFIGMSIIDTLWGERRLSSLSQFIRNTFFGIFAFLIAIFFVLISIYSNASSGSDAVSAKALKLIISNAIPVVGGTVSESLKFLGGSVVSIKNSVGLASVIFLLALFIPTLVLLWGSGTVLNLFSVLCEYFGVGELKGTVSHLKNAVDFTLASYAIIVVAAFINIGYFMNTVPTVIS